MVLSSPATVLAWTNGVAAETKAERKARILERLPLTLANQSRLSCYRAAQAPIKAFLIDAHLPNLLPPSSFEERYDFSLGDAVFERPWVVAPSSTIASDGLGPLFNARSCIGCHINDGRGHPPQPSDSNMVSMLFKLTDQNGKPDLVFGAQLQDQAIPGMQSEGHVTVAYESVTFTYPDGSEIDLRKPIYSTDANLSDNVSLNPRIAPPLFGLGPGGDDR